MKLIAAVTVAWLFYLLQSMLCERFWRKGLTAGISFQEEAVVCGEEAALSETIANYKFLPLSILRVKFGMSRELRFVSEDNVSVTDKVYRNDVFSVFPYQQIVRTLHVSCQKRGYYEIGQMELISHDLFFSRHMVEILPVSTHLAVYPRMVDPDRFVIPFQKMLGMVLSKNQLCRDPFEFQTIREYQTYDSMREVNWKATARTGELKVNVNEPTASQKVVIFLNVESDHPWPSQAVREEAISLCASFAAGFLEHGISVSIISNSVDHLTELPVFVEEGAGREHTIACMEALSRLDEDKPSLPFDRILDGAADGRERENALYLMISSSQRQEIKVRYQEYCRHNPGSVWIAPLRPDETLCPDGCPAALWMKWEVTYDKI